jgi:cytochrome c oxidase subunit 3
MKEESSGVLGIHPSQIFIWLFLGVVSMLFAGFSSAYILRTGFGDWQRVSMPKLLVFNSAILILSSITFELAKKTRTRRQELLLLTLALAVLFIIGQIFLYLKLQKLGIYINSTPYVSFFYILTVTHILHFLGGFIWLVYIAFSSSSAFALSLCSTYWHYFTLLWVYLLVLMYSV